MLYGQVARYALGLLTSGQPIGATPRENVEAGDVYLLYTQAGVIAFLRDEKHPVGEPTIAEPYTELPPTATTIWYGALQTSDEWLWATAAPNGAGTATSYQLSPLPGIVSGTAVISVDPATGIATAAGISVTPGQTALTAIPWSSVSAFAQ
jgi:hypothetical protein